MQHAVVQVGRDMYRSSRCNKSYFVPRQSWALWPLLYSWCVTPFVSVECGHGIGFVLASPRVLVFLMFSCYSVPRVPLFHVFVSEVPVGSAIRSPEYRSIQRRL